MKQQKTGTNSNATEHTASDSSPAGEAGGRLDGTGAMEPSRQQPREVVWGDGRRPDPATICSKRRTNGEPCRKTALKGTEPPLCVSHGAAAPAVRARARIRLENATARMADRLLGIADDESTPPAVRLAAIRDALDRGGVSAKTSVEVEVGPTPAWKQVFDAAMGGGSRSESRARRGIPDDGTAVLDAEIVGEDVFDGVGMATPAATANTQAPQASFDTSSHRQGGSTGAATGTNPNKTGQRVTDDLSGSRVDANYPPIQSLAEAHPEDELPRRIRTNERNRAITPKMTNARTKRRRE